jgi:hypothetical protein
LCHLTSPELQADLAAQAARTAIGREGQGKRGDPIRQYGTERIAKRGRPCLAAPVTRVAAGRVRLDRE